MLPVTRTRSLPICAKVTVPAISEPFGTTRSATAHGPSTSAGVAHAPSKSAETARAQQVFFIVFSLEDRSLRLAAYLLFAEACKRGHGSLRADTLARASAAVIELQPELVF